MLWINAILSLAAIVIAVAPNIHAQYTPDWTSLDARPLPQWYDQSKFGIFIHWGVFSVPSFGSEWFWQAWQGSQNPDYVNFMKQNYRPDFTYADFGHDFTAEFFDPNAWADLFKASGAKYVVLTSKHHEGFTLWPSKVSFNWNAMELGPKKDLVGMLASAIRSRTDLHFGLYHSLFEWFHPLYLQDKANNYKTQNFVAFKTMPELYEIVQNYKPDVIWSDGDWEAPDTYWNSTEFIAWLYNESPVKDTVVTNDRWGSDTGCHHGGFYTCQDRYNPGKLVNHKWENCMTVDRDSWGYVRKSTLANYLTAKEIIDTMVETFSCGGNILLNVGPSKDGRILPIFEERLREIGSWLSVNGEAVYGSIPWSYQNDTVTPGVWYTAKKVSGSTVVYAFLQQWPNTGQLVLGSVKPSSQTSATLVGYKGGEFGWAKNPGGGIVLKVPVIPFYDMPCMWVWTLKLTNLM